MDLKAAGERALERALAAYDKGIIDPMTMTSAMKHPESSKFIDRCIRSEEDGLGWKGALAPDGYRYNGDGFEWCGAFAAYAWAESVTLELRRLYFSSTDRLNAWGQYKALFGTENEKRVMAKYPRPDKDGRAFVALNERSFDTSLDRSLVKAFDPRPGDILLVGGVVAGGGFRSWGTHVCLVESFNPKTGEFATVEGNATGAVPGQVAKVQGVIRNVRKLGLRPGESLRTYHARRLIRPGAKDLVG